MQTHFRHAVVALLLAAGTGTASAQTVITRDDTQLQLTPAQRTTIYRTIVPQSRGRRPVIRERIVIEPVAPAPVVRERVITRSLDDYAYGDRYDRYDSRSDYAYAPPLARERVVTAPADAYGSYAYAVGTRVAPSARLAPLPPAVVAEVPAIRSYRYMVYQNRVLLIDPATSIIVGEATEY
ncbi:MAG: hypothetical protein QOI12_3440 [Alphaproteobacteria bacterium]|jgi:hypothetical protein|nr:hypothetical protein [Alphaproteobacteria bacterium]